jgi:hypothetical protein
LWGLRRVVVKASRDTCLDVGIRVWGGVGELRSATCLGKLLLRRKLTVSISSPTQGGASRSRSGVCVCGVCVCGRQLAVGPTQWLLLSIGPVGRAAVGSHSPCWVFRDPLPPPSTSPLAPLSLPLPHFLFLFLFLPPCLQGWWRWWGLGCVRLVGGQGESPIGAWHPSGSLSFLHLPTSHISVSSGAHTWSWVSRKLTSSCEPVPSVLC